METYFIEKEEEEGCLFTEVDLKKIWEKEMSLQLSKKQETQEENKTETGSVTNAMDLNATSDKCSVTVIAQKEQEKKNKGMISQSDTPESIASAY